LPKLFSEGVRITDNGSMLNLYFTHSLRSGKMLIGLALIDSGSDDEVPESLLNLRKIKVFPNGEKVVSIISEDLKTGVEERLL